MHSVNDNKASILTDNFDLAALLHASGALLSNYYAYSAKLLTFALCIDLQDSISSDAFLFLY